MSLEGPSHTPAFDYYSLSDASLKQSIKSLCFINVRPNAHITILAFWVFCFGKFFTGELVIKK